MLKELINTGNAAMNDEETVVQIAITQIKRSPAQQRKNFDADALDELAASIREHGVLQPLVVTPNEKGSYNLIYGERRLRASQVAHLITVPCIVRDATPLQASVWGLIENEQRADLNAMERALWYYELSREHGMTHAEIAQITGKSRSTVTNTLRMLQLSEEEQNLVLTGHLDESSARELLRVKDESERKALAKQAASSGDGKRAISATVDSTLGKQRTPPPAQPARKVYLPPSDERFDIPLAQAQRQAPDNSAVVSTGSGGFTVQSKNYVSPTSSAVIEKSREEIMLDALLEIARYCAGNMARSMHADVISIATRALDKIGVEWEQST